MNRKQGILIAGALLLSTSIGAGLGWWLKAQGPSDTAQISAEPAKRKILYYKNPMGTGHTSPVPMKDDMGMDYIPVYADENAAAADSGTVKIDPRLVQNLGVRTASVERRNIGQSIETVGTVVVDEHRISYLNPRVSGWLETLQARAVGDTVKRGQVLATIYSPDLVSAQEEFLVALRGVRQRTADPQFASESRALLDAARERLRLLNLPEAEIRALERSGKAQRSVPLRAPHGGIITELNARQGGYVTPDIRIYTLADLSRVWVNVDIYASQLPWIKPGDPVTLSIPALPERQWQGRIDYLYPTLNTQSRTVQARLAFANPDGVLRPGMYGTARIQAGSQAERLVVPSEAVLRGANRNVVLIAEGEGRFRPVVVRTGAESGGFTEILDGLQAGQKAVVSGQFLIDSEASLKGLLNRLQAGDTATAETATPPAGKGMDMAPAPSTPMPQTSPSPAPSAPGGMQHGGH